ncbi:MAG: hypothetical protein NZM15_09155 [Flavobacteriales bacterium]|nr:hypothetical protein [Flavobacteriales bacterium]MDW8432855.1 hypothetical protein [Flavobacteriales bacterium]
MGVGVLLITVFSLAGVLMSLRTRRLDGLVSAFLAGGFVGLGFGHLSEWALSSAWSVVPALALALFVPVEFQRGWRWEKSGQVWALFSLNGLHTLLGTVMALTLDMSRGGFPTASLIFGLHEWLHKAALVSLFRRLGCTSAKAFHLAFLTVVAVLLGGLCVHIPQSGLYWLENFVALGLALSGLLHIRAALQARRRSGQTTLTFWLMVISGCIIFALSHSLDGK